jgi:hypothetical protein
MPLRARWGGGHTHRYMTGPQGEGGKPPGSSSLYRFFNFGNVGGVPSSEIWGQTHFRIALSKSKPLAELPR